MIFYMKTSSVLLRMSLAKDVGNSLQHCLIISFLREFSRIKFESFKIEIINIKTKFIILNEYCLKSENNSEN